MERHSLDCVFGSAGHQHPVCRQRRPSVAHAPCHRTGRDPFLFFEIAESVLPGNLVSYAVAFFVAAFITAVAAFAFIARRLFGF